MQKIKGAGKKTRSNSKIKEPNPIGIPPLYNSPQELQSKIDEYFNSDSKYTIAGLCLFLGFASRQSFYDYENKPNFAYTIKKARLRLEEYYESKVLTAGIQTGVMYMLNCFKYQEPIDNEIQNKNKKPDLSSLTNEDLNKLIKAL